MKLKSIPRELFAEVLDYIADYERLSGLDQILEGQYTVLDVRGALREVALQIRHFIEEEKEGRLPDYKKDERLSPRARDILSALSPTDERRLLDRFGLLED